MPSMEDRSLVFLSGTVNGDVRFVGDEARLSLACKEGLFFVRVFGQDQIRVCQILRDGDKVVVIGGLHSSVFKRCKSHHAWIKALAVVPDDEHLASEPQELFRLWLENESEATDVVQAVAQSSLAERLLREYEERSRYASEVTATYTYTIHVKDEASLVVDWLCAFTSPVSGVSPEEIEDDWTRVVHPDDVEKVDEHLQVLTSGQPDVIEFRVVAGYDEARWVRNDARPVQEEGQVVRIYGVAQDVTDRKWLESQVLELQKMAMVNRLVGGITHEFNNLLTLIMSRVELMRYRLGQEYDVLLRDDVEEITQAAEQTAWLTQRLLAFSRRKMILPELLDVNALVADLGEMLGRAVREGIELVVMAGSNVGCVKADQGQIEQIIINLVIHVCDHMSEGGRLTLETTRLLLDEAQARQVDLPPGPYVKLAVSGAGPGMGRAEISQVGDNRSGVGLPVAYRVVGLIGACIRADSHTGQPVDGQPGEGVTFSVYLPQVSDADIVEAVKQAQAAPPASETVLVVEDEDRVRSLASHILEINGFTVLEGRSGEEALQICEGHPGPIHLVVSDVMLPGMSGPELVEQLMALHPGIKAVFISGYVDAPFVPPKGVPFLRKPFAGGDLVRAVYRAMSDDAS
jgi:two-component system cell cycle sensor histidine kinase/response regulator CckA